MISIVVPAYRSRDSLPILLTRLEVVLGGLGREFEVIVIDDCSPDDTWQVLKELKTDRGWLRIVRLLKNSGQHNALLCGFSLAKGSVIVTMDDDLQNVPEDIPKLVAAIDEGYDLAVGAYDEKKHSKGRNLGGALIDATQRRIFGLPASFQLTSFRAIDRSVVANVVAMAGVYPYVTSMLLSHTARYTNVPVRHEVRQFGSSNYNLRRSALLAFNLLLNYSAYPLYFVVALCLLALGCSGVLSVWVLWRNVVGNGTIPGWASTITAISFFNGLILLALVVHSLYLSRLNQQVTRSRVGFTVGELRE